MEEGSKKNLMTYESVKALEDELEDLRVNRRKEVAEKLKEARAQGDLSENAEYDAAKEEQREIEARIEEINKILLNVEVADDDAKGNTVTIGSTVKLFDEEFKEEIEYKIVGSIEADILKNKISNESPVGAALMGKKKNQKITVDTANGTLKFKIISITR
ncbi:MAG: transcription elongation factor GreA [Lachnospiraceae bacterium]|nr:transcription elongation factor GreA [Lachnospiraceae bacterium]